MQKLVEVIVKSLVDNPDDVQIQEIDNDESIVFEISVAADDMGKIIGKQGRTVKALRTVINAAAIKSGKKVMVDIV